MQPLSGSPKAKDLLDPGRPVARFFARTPWTDVVVAVLVALIALWLASDIGIVSLDGPARRSLYQTVAGLSGTLFGLTMTSISILAASIDKPLGGMPKGMPQSLVVGLGHPMFALLRTLGLMLTATLTMMVLDTTANRGAPLSQAILLSVACAAAARIWRVLFLLSYLLKARMN